TTCTVSHIITHCTTQAVPRDHMHMNHALTHCTTQAVPRDHLHSEPCTSTHITQAVPRDSLHSEPCTNTLHHTTPRDHTSSTHQQTAPHKLYLGTTCTMSHTLTHCTTQVVPRDHLHSEPYINTLYHTSCT
ncbi:predicted protein, partial [Nematostella vectensis]